MESIRDASPPVLECTLSTLPETGFLEEPALAQVLGLKVVTVRNRRSRGEGPPYIKVHGTRVIYPVADLRQWLLARTVRPVAASTLIDGSKRRRRSSEARASK